MRFWFDTEFIEDGKTIDLLAIGVVAEDGRMYYAEPTEANRAAAPEWVKINVLPHLSGQTTPRAKIAADLVAFMGEKPEIWAYYADYDWVALCQLFGRMIDLPKGWPKFCRDVKQLCDSKGNPQLPKQFTTEHHALADALWTQQAWVFLQKPDPRDPDYSRQGIFQTHNCYRCLDGALPCIVGTPNKCEFPHARND